MGNPLPIAVARARGVDLQVIDYVTVQRQARVDTTGKGLIQLQPPESGQLWRVERIVVTALSAATLGVSVYSGDVTPANLRDWTELPPGWSGVAEYPSLLTIDAGSAGLAILFAGGANGDSVTASIQYQQVAKVLT